MHYTMDKQMIKGVVVPIVMATAKTAARIGYILASRLNMGKYRGEMTSP